MIYRRELNEEKGLYDNRGEMADSDGRLSDYAASLHLDGFLLL
jgi:hypothetical protein